MSYETYVEAELAAALRSAILPELSVAGYDPDALAGALGIVPTRAKMFLAQSEWPLRASFRIIEELNLPIVISVAVNLLSPGSRLEGETNG